MNASWVTRRTWITCVAGALAVGLVYALSGLLPDPFGTAVSDLGEFAIVALAAVMALRTALRLTPGEPLRRRWLLIAFGVALFAVGDGVWSVIEVLLRSEPFPSLADPFYVAVYPVLGAGLISAALAFRAFVDVKRIALIVSVVTVLALVGMYFGLLHSVALDTEMAGLAKALSLFYPTADLVLLFAPALFAALAVRSMGAGRLAAPWWAVVIGVALLAVTDAAFAWLDFQELYRSGSIIDIGWMLGYVLIGAGALLTRDLLAPAQSPAEERLAA